MKIKTISCTQFAGIRDRNISFDDGINLVYGKNESGKSTLVNLLARTLFQNARIDGRSDKEFKSLYFPGTRKGSKESGDFVDGKITLETDNGTYTLTKEWGSDARCTLSTPDGVIRDQKKIDAILKDVLLYGEGVYADMLFSSQRNTDLSLQTILDASKRQTQNRKSSMQYPRHFPKVTELPLTPSNRRSIKKLKKLPANTGICRKMPPFARRGAGQPVLARS